MEGDVLFYFISQDYRNKHSRELLEATLPFDYLEKVREHYNKTNEIINYKPRKNKYNTNPEYNEYLNSKEWKSLRKRILETRNKCEQCGTEEGTLHLHHLHYRNFKHELDEDLKVLCINCHREIHNK